MRQVDIQARTVEDAVRLALEQLGRTRDQVKVEVLATDPGGDEVLVRVIAPDIPGAGGNEEISPRGRRFGPQPGPGVERFERGNRAGEGGGGRPFREGERGGYGGPQGGRPGPGPGAGRERGGYGDRGDRGPRQGDRYPRGERREGYDRAPRYAGADADPGLPGEIELDTSLRATEGEHATPQDAVAPVAAEILQKMLLEMRIRGTLSRRTPEEEGEAAFEEDNDTLVLNVHGLSERDKDILIGRRGETLEALQFLLNLILGRQVDLWARVIVDVEGWRLRRKLALINLARRTAEQVQARQQAIPLEAMSPYERRIIHIALREHEAVTTESTGAEPERRVVVMPR